MGSEIYILLSFLIILIGAIKYRRVIFLSFLDNKIQKIQKSFYQSEAKKNNHKILFEEIEEKLFQLEKKKEEQIFYLIQTLDREFKIRSEKIDHEFEVKKARIKENFDVHYIKIQNYSYTKLVEKSFKSTYEHFVKDDSLALTQSHIAQTFVNSKINLS